MEEKMLIFLPKVTSEAFDKLDNLIEMYQQAAWLWAEPEIVRQYAIDFIATLTPKKLLDRRYINEDTVSLHPFNMSWLLDDIPKPMEPMLEENKSKRPCKASNPAKPGNLAKRKKPNKDENIHV